MTLNAKDEQDLANRFAFHPATDTETKDLHGEARKTMRDAARWALETLPEGRERSMVITKLEEAMFWANASIARRVS